MGGEPHPMPRASYDRETDPGGTAARFISSVSHSGPQKRLQRLHGACQSRALRRLNWRVLGDGLRLKTPESGGMQTQRSAARRTPGIQAQAACGLRQISIPVKPRHLSLSRSLNARGSRCAAHASFARILPVPRVATADLVASFSFALACAPPIPARVPVV